MHSHMDVKLCKVVVSGDWAHMLFNMFNVLLRVESTEFTCIFKKSFLSILLVHFLYFALEMQAVFIRSSCL